MQSRSSESIIYRRRERLLYSSRSWTWALLHPPQSAAALFLPESSGWGKEISSPLAKAPVSALPSSLGKNWDFPPFFAGPGQLLLLRLTLGKSLLLPCLPKARRDPAAPARAWCCSADRGRRRWGWKWTICLFNWPCQSEPAGLAPEQARCETTGALITPRALLFFFKYRYICIFGILKQRWSSNLCWLFRDRWRNSCNIAEQEVEDGNYIFFFSPLSGNVAHFFMAQRLWFQWDGSIFPFSILHLGHPPGSPR